MIHSGHVMKKHWIQGAIKHPGALKEAYPGMAKGGFSNAELNKIAKKGGVNAKRANLAKTLKKMH